MNYISVFNKKLLKRLNPGWNVAAFDKTEFIYWKDSFGYNVENGLGIGSWALRKMQRYILWQAREGDRIKI